MVALVTALAAILHPKSLLQSSSCRWSRQVCWGIPRSFHYCSNSSAHLMASTPLSTKDLLSSFKDLYAPCQGFGVEPTCAQTKRIQCNNYFETAGATAPIAFCLQPCFFYHKAFVNGIWNKVSGTLNST